ncbi:MAG: hypothetical protein NVS9B4_09280 [Candidatus Acidiferrum sp.]
MEAKANYERAIGRTLDVNRVSVSGGAFERDNLIPGTLHGKVIGTSNPADLLSAPSPPAGVAAGQR